MYLVLYMYIKLHTCISITCIQFEINISTSKIITFVKVFIYYIYLAFLLSYETCTNTIIQ